MVNRLNALVLLIAVLATMAAPTQADLLDAVETPGPADPELTVGAGRALEPILAMFELPPACTADVGVELHSDDAQAAPIACVDNSSEPCADDDPLCQITCESGFDGGLDGPEADPDEGRVVVPGSGQDENGVIWIFGHYTICF